MHSINNQQDIEPGQDSCKQLEKKQWQLFIQTQQQGQLTLQAIDNQQSDVSNDEVKINGHNKLKVFL